MQTATVQELQNHATSLLIRVQAGEEIVITERGESIARLVPERPVEAKKVNWADAPEVTRDRSGEQMLTAQESLELIHEASGRW